jgi:hypothetical protein
MTPLLIVLTVVFAIGLAIGAYALFAPKAKAPVVPPPPEPIEPFTPSEDWTTEAGTEFAGLNESARCDMIFAVQDLDDERSARLLLHAMDDPSDAVALAAAHALVRRGAAQSIQEYAQRHPGERAQRIVTTLDFLD